VLQGLDTHAVLLRENADHVHHSLRQPERKDCRNVKATYSLIRELLVQSVFNRQWCGIGLRQVPSFHGHYEERARHDDDGTVCVTEAEGYEPIMLVVGNLRSWQRQGLEIPQIDGFHFVGLQDVTADLMGRLRPDVVLSALMGESFDALDLARRLSGLGYGGLYRALTNALPNPSAIVSEVRASAPGLDFDLYIIDPPAHRLDS